MKVLLNVTLLVVFLLCSSLVFADCSKNGITYPTGTEIGGFVCSGEGNWVKK